MDGAAVCVSKMTMVLYVSLVFLILAVLVAAFTRTLLPRILFGSSILVWATYLLYFQFEGLARIVARRPPEHPLADNPYVVGVIAYKDALVELRFSIAVIILALVILMLVFRRRRAP